MTVREQIVQDIKSAMKAGDKIRLETLRTLRAVLMEREIEKRGGTPMTPEDEIAVLVTAAKKRRESIEQFEKGGRPELVELENKELAIIQEYLPKQMGVDDVQKVIDEVVAQTGAAVASDFGKVMPLVMKQLKGKADGKVIQELVKKKLGG